MKSRQPAQFHLLLHSAHLIEDRLRVRLAALGVQPRQARVLDALERMGETSQAELAKEFDLTAASMSTMIGRLLAGGLIHRRIDKKELRKNVVRLTKKGSALLDSIYEEWAEIDREILATMGERDAKYLGELTRNLRDRLGGRRPGSASEKKDKT